MQANQRRQFLGAATAAALAACGLGTAHAQTKPAAGARKIVLGQSVPLTGAADQIGLA